MEYSPGETIGWAIKQDSINLKESKPYKICLVNTME